MEVQEIKRCDLCETIVEFAMAGSQFRFIAHDDAFCRAATKDRIALLTKLLSESAIEQEKLRRTIDEMRFGPRKPVSPAQMDEMRLIASQVDSLADRSDWTNIDGDATNNTPQAKLR